MKSVKSYNSIVVIVGFLLSTTFFLSQPLSVSSFSKHHHVKGLQATTTKKKNEQHPFHQFSNAKTITTASPSALQMSTMAKGGSESNNNSTNNPSIAKLRTIIQKNSFLLGMATAVLFAKTYPSLGVNGGILKPELFIGKFGVTCIFLLSGVSLELSELKEAITNIKLNTVVQLGSFIVWPFMVGVPLVKMIQRFTPNLLPKALLDGLIILTCLPTTVNMCVLLAGRARGNVASALANAVFGNLLGIFATPALLMFFFGTMIELPFLDMVWKLCNKVLFPVGECVFLCGIMYVYYLLEHSILLIL